MIPMRVILTLCFVAGCSDAPTSQSAQNNQASVANTRCAQRPRDWPFLNPADFPTPIGGLTFAEVAVVPSGKITWNHREIGIAGLRENLEAAGQFRPTWMMPIVLRTTPQSSCEVAEQLRAIMDEAEVCRRGGCIEAERWHALGFPSFEVHQNRFGNAPPRP